MAIYKLIANGVFGPLEIDAMSKAYEKRPIDLEIANRDNPITELIAKAIVNVVATDKRDPNLIEQRAINALRIRKTDAALINAPKNTPAASSIRHRTAQFAACCNPASAQHVVRKADMDLCTAHILLTQSGHRLWV